MNTSTYVEQYLSAAARILREIDHGAIEQVVGVLYRAWQQGRTVFTMGNGGSASTATHLACDLAKVTIVPGKKRLRVMALTDNTPLVSAWTNDSGFGSIFAEQLEPWLEAGDVLIGLSVHGGSGMGDAGPWSQNLVRAVQLARKRGAKVIGFSGFGGGAMKQMADVCLVVPIDEEPLGTPLVEAFHVVLHHLVATALRERIKAEPDA
jgi:D-sedoheptulose 7-phosphate isomerase